MDKKRTDWKKAYEGQVKVTEYLATTHAKHKSYCNHQRISSIIMVTLLFIAFMIAVLLWNKDANDLREENLYLKGANSVQLQQIAELNSSVDNLRNQVYVLSSMQEEWTINMWVNMTGWNSLIWTSNKDFYINGEKVW